MLFRTKRFWCILLLPISALCMLLAHQSPTLTDRIFSQGVYRVITATYGRIFGYLPFSVSQFLIILFPIIGVIYILVALYRIITKPNLRKKCAVNLIANTACTIGIISIMFTLGAGLNYARPELGELIGLEIRPSSVQELAALTEILVNHANELSTQVERDEYGRMIISADSTTQLSRDARVIFRNAADDFPFLRGFVPHTNPIVYSHFMSRLRITGVYSPFTMEPHVNIHIMDYLIPAIMIHELAHFRGIMREDEANFLGWLIGYRSGHPDFMYSSTMLALAYTSNQLHRASRDAHSRIMGELCQFVWVDFNANRAYWRQFEGPLAEISQAANDAYLRANRQEDGVQSYGRVVDLLLAYFRDKL